MLNKYIYNRVLLLSLILLCCVYALPAQKQIKLVILHTNDTHSQVEPTDKNASKNADMGGYARRMGVIQQIREQEKNVLLFDAGDFWQGTPYFNFYNGEIEVDALNRMKYDAATLGNHEFDNGVDKLVEMLQKVNFPIVCSNYTIEDENLAKIVKPYLVLERFGLRIGVLGLGVNPDRLIIKNNYKGISYQDPIETANKTAEFLKLEQKCDLVICLSHLGGAGKNAIVTDFDVAAASKYIDVIIGGHTHEYITDTEVKNADGKNIVLAQMGKSGLYMGRIDLTLQKK